MAEQVSKKALTSTARVSNLIQRTADVSLAQPWKKLSATITQAILRESERTGLDPLLVTAVIKHESRFNPVARGRHGEIGLMQIKPSTARWIASISGHKWKGAASLEDPETNIQLGTAYLAYLKNEFESRKKLYLAAYNMGAGNVNRAIRKKAVPIHYFSRVNNHYTNLTLQLRGGMAHI